MPLLRHVSYMPLNPGSPRSDAAALQSAYGKSADLYADLERFESDFAKLESKLAQRKNVSDPRALAAWIGDKKYGKSGMAKKAAAAQKHTDRFATDAGGNYDAAQQHVERFSEGNNSLEGVEIFAAGKHRGKTYTNEDLDDMVRNFNEFSKGQKPGFYVPAVLGHEEDQNLLDRSDLPAAGWVSKLYREGYKLIADFEDVPDNIATLIRNKRYRTCSSEVYDEPPEGIAGKGKMLRRVAFLGGDIPQIKDLEEIPLPTRHGEDRRFAQWQRINLSSDSREAKCGAFYRCFHETEKMSVAKFGPSGDSAQGRAMWAKASLQGGKKKDGGFSKSKMKKGRKHAPKGKRGGVNWGFEEQDMQRDQMIEKLGEAGLDTNTLKDVPDEALAEMCRFTADDDDDNDDDDTNDAYSENDPADGLADHALDNLPDPDSSDSATKLREHARRYADRARRFAERAKKYLEKYCAVKHDDAADDPQPKEPAKDKTAAPFSEQKLARMIQREVQSAISGTIKASLEKLEKFREQQEAAQQQMTVESFCEVQLQAGRLTSAEYLSKSAGGPDGPVYRRLLRASPIKKAEIFREKGQSVELTELQAQMKEIEERPTLFGERFHQPAAAKSGSKEEADAVVTAHFQKFSEDYVRAGYTHDSFVANFNELNDANRAAMLEEYRKSL